MRLKKLAALMISFTMFSQPLLAQNNLSSVIQDDMYRSRISEYFFIRTGKEILKPVRLLGHIEKQGLYHVPENTPLTTLFALAGGPAREADVEKITVTHSDGTVEIKDLNKLMIKGQDVSLKEGDIIFVEKEKHIWSERTNAILLAVSSLLSVGLTAYVVFHND